jgi:predicted MFS family arabinose efflux permease
MVPEHLCGRAIAIAMVGTPLALSLGIPAGTLLGSALGWRTTFGLMTVLTLILIGWVLAKVPDFEGQASARQRSIVATFTMRGIRSVLFVTLGFVLAHNILYTYIAPFVARAGLSASLDLVLLAFGIAALLGIWVVGVLIDRWLRELVLVSAGLFATASFVLGVWGDTPIVLYAGIVVWGLAFGGAATLFQTAAAKTAGQAADVAQSMIVTVWNMAIAGGGLLGGVMLEMAGVASLPWPMMALLVIAFFATWQAKTHGFTTAA